VFEFVTVRTVGMIGVDVDVAAAGTANPVKDGEGERSWVLPGPSWADESVDDGPVRVLLLLLVEAGIGATNVSER
jgi:hypothetical protein